EGVSYDTWCISLEEAESYLRQLDQFVEEIEYARHEFRSRLDRYQRETTPETRVDLQSSIAYFEKHIRPLVIQQRVPERHFVTPADTLEFGIDESGRDMNFVNSFMALTT
ncbi:MAG: hypothetical protein AB1422_18220, partial [bacterium]